MTTATATKTKGGKGEAKSIEAPSVEIPKGTTHKAMIAELVPIDQIAIADKNDRVRDAAFTEKVRERAASMGEIGLLQPILVRKREREKPTDRLYELAAGEIRYRAAMLLGWARIAAVVLDAGQDVLDVRTAENLQRSDLDEDAKAMAVGHMLDREIEALGDEQGVKLQDLDAPAQDAIREASVKRVAARLGWPVPRVRDYAYMAQLPEEVLSLARRGRLSLSHCRVLAQLADPEMMVRFANANAAGENPVLEPMRSLKDLKHDVSRETCRLNKVPWDLGIEFGPKHRDGRQYACTKCPHNSLNRTGLFDGADLPPANTNHFDANHNFKVTDLDLSGGLCGKLECYRAKNAATKQAWRGAADRIARKVGEAKPAERARLAGQLLKEAAERCDFVPMTVFGRLARERIDERLKAGTPAKTAANAAASKEREEQEQARWKAENQLRSARQTIERKIESEVSAKLFEMEPWRGVLFQTLLRTRLGRDTFDYGRAKPDTIKKFKSAAAAVLHGQSERDALIAIMSMRGNKDDVLDLDGNLDDYRILVEIFDLKNIPPSPQLADFLPKPKPKPKKHEAVDKAKPAKKSAKKKAARRGGKAQKRKTANPVTGADDVFDGEEE